MYWSDAMTTESDPGIRAQFAYRSHNDHVMFAIRRMPDGQSLGAP
jgi:hypothetical protein